MAPRTKAGQTINVDDVFPPDQANQPTQLRTITLPETPDHIEWDDATELGNVLAELGADEDGGGFVVVNREEVSPGGKRDDVYIDRFQVADFSLDNLKNRWGPGRYKISVYRSGGAGLATRKVITIAKDPTAQVAAVPSSQPIDLTPLLQTMQEGFKQMAMMMQQSQAPQTSRSDLLAELVTMKEIFGGGAPAPTQNFNPVELMKLGMEMAGKAGGEGEGNNAWVNKMIDMFGPVLMPTIQSAIAEKAAPAQPVRHLPPPAASAAAVVKPVAPIEEENPVNAIIVNYLRLLSNAARSQAPVDQYADSILSMVPAPQVVELENMLKPDDWREQIRKHTPVIDQYPEWFGSLRDTLLAFIEEDRQDAGAGESVTTHLTPAPVADSVSPHENGHTTIGATNTGDAASAT